MTNAIRPAQTQTFEHTISGLLTKRSEILQEAANLRERQNKLAMDLEALEHVLRTLGYDGALGYEEAPSRVHLFFRGELREFVLARLKEGPHTTRALSEALLQVEGKTATSRRMLADVTGRVGKALRLMQASGYVQRRRLPDEKHFVWFLKADDPGGWA